MEKSRVLFNEKCSICNFEIKHYKKRSSLNFEDCSAMEDKYLKALYVQFSDGTELKGVDAFIYVWSNTRGYNWLAKIIRLPIIFQIAKFCYIPIAFIIFPSSVTLIEFDFTLNSSEIDELLNVINKKIYKINFILFFINFY